LSGCFQRLPESSELIEVALSCHCYPNEACLILSFVQIVVYFVFLQIHFVWSLIVVFYLTFFTNIFFVFFTLQVITLPEVATRGGQAISIGPKLLALHTLMEAAQRYVYFIFSLKNCPVAGRGCQSHQNWWRLLWVVIAMPMEACLFLYFVWIVVYFFANPLCSEHDYCFLFDFFTNNFFTPQVITLLPEVAKSSALVPSCWHYTHQQRLPGGMFILFFHKKCVQLLPEAARVIRIHGGCSELLLLCQQRYVYFCILFEVLCIFLKIHFVWSLIFAFYLTFFNNFFFTPKVITLPEVPTRGGQVGLDGAPKSLALQTLMELTRGMFIFLFFS